MLLARVEHVGACDQFLLSIKSVRSHHGSSSSLVVIISVSLINFCNLQVLFYSLSDYGHDPLAPAQGPPMKASRSPFALGASCFSLEISLFEVLLLTRTANPGPIVVEQGSHPL